MRLPLSIIPDGIHTKSRILDLQPSDPRQKLLLPPIYLYPAFLIIRQCQPLVAPVARADRIRVSSTCRRGIEAYLPLDTACWANFEGSDVAGKIEGVGARRCEEVFPAVGEGDDV